MRKTSTVIITGLSIVLLAVMLVGLTFVASGPGAMMSGVMISGARMPGTIMHGMMGSTMMPGLGIGAAHMIVGPILWALLIGGSLLSVMWLVQHAGASTSNTAGAGQQTALDILKMRFARGDITKEQFEDMQRAVGA